MQYTKIVFPSATPTLDFNVTSRFELTHGRVKTPWINFKTGTTLDQVLEIIQEWLRENSVQMGFSTIQNVIEATYGRNNGQDTATIKYDEIGNPLSGTFTGTLSSTEKAMLLSTQYGRVEWTEYSTEKNTTLTITKGRVARSSIWVALEGTISYDNYSPLPAGY